VDSLYRFVAALTALPVSAAGIHLPPGAIAAKRSGSVGPTLRGNMATYDMDCGIGVETCSAGFRNSQIGTLYALMLCMVYRSRVARCERKAPAFRRELPKEE